ncbi:MAG: hypothetical protein JXR07_19855 [Reichenbachiella sp.]
MKLKLIIFLVVLLGLNTTEVFSQEFSSRLWHSGWVVTMDRDTLRGEINYDIPTNSVQVMVTRQRQKKILTFSSKKLMYFQIFDATLNNYRQFYSIPYQIRSDFKAPILFEILYEGPLTLMLRERIVVESDPYQTFTSVGSSAGSIERLEYTYYFIDTKGKITFYEGGKGEIYEIFKKNSDKVKEYIKKNKLSVEDMRDLVRITAFYNSL